MTSTTLEGLQVMLFVAAQRGDEDEVERLLSFRADLVDCTSTEGQTPLHVSVYNNRRVVCELLLCRGAAVNAVQRGTGLTPLMMAAHCGHSQLCEILLSCG